MTIDRKLAELLRCPATGQTVRPASKSELEALNARLTGRSRRTGLEPPPRAARREGARPAALAGTPTPAVLSAPVSAAAWPGGGQGGSLPGDSAAVDSDAVPRPTALGVRDCVPDPSSLENA